jgi:hypothetical protein
MLAELDRSAAGGGEPGCFTPDGRTCPTATRVEGLTAAMAFLPDSEAALRAQIQQAAGQGIDFLLRSQVRQGPCAGGFPHEVGSYERKKNGPAKARNEARRTEIRMDYVQHALDGMIQWRELQAAAARR